MAPIRRYRHVITGMNHTGFVVRDLAKALEFCCDAIGMEVSRTVERDGGPICQVVGYDDAHLRIALLRTGDGRLLELIQYVYPPGSERPTEERNALGAAHLAFDVDDIESTYQEIIGRGAVALNPPVEVAPGRKACYFQDPEGNWLELIEAT